jgi:ribosome-associated toxin RatA of RatAB toxin-antitoxin module
VRHARLIAALAALWALPGAHAAEEVAVEAEREGAAVRVTARATLEAAPELVWGTLTDFERLAGFIPGISRSHVIERHGNETIVEQSGEARLLLFSYPIEVTLASREHPPHRIDVRLLKGNLKRLDGGYRVEPLGAGRLRLRWSGVIEPESALPPLIGEYLMRASVENQFLGMVREIERRAREEARP